MFRRSGGWAGVSLSNGIKPLIEALESRTLLSVAPTIIIHPATGSSTVSAYTPSQIRHAYGFDQVNLDGQGQTIAIVDAYDDPNIQSDLATFDAHFGLGAPPSLTVLNEHGQSVLPFPDPEWAGEISLDVEWTHAIAPQANILLVEATTAQPSDMLAAVNYARNVPAVSVVSMSWGGSEGLDETASDIYFTTPPDHQGVTFVASTGDSSAASGAQWPSASPNVVSVGGTTLHLADSNGTYGSEGSWSGTNGGYSTVEPEPTYQEGAQNSGVRGVPDVSYDADPNTGFSIYDSYSDPTQSWLDAGGTSAGAPQWAALIALANQSRATASSPTLDGVSQTLPILYNLYGAPDSAGYSAYTSDFNDIADPGATRWGGWGFAGGGATAGYDFTTGLGTPKAGPIIQALGSTTPVPPPVPVAQGPSSTPPFSPKLLPDSPISGTILTSPPTTAIAGQSGRLRVSLANTSLTTVTGPISISLYASTGSVLSFGQTPFATKTVKKLTLRPAFPKVVGLHFQEPAGLTDGSYSLITSITAMGTGTAPAMAATPSPVWIATPVVDLAARFAAGGSLLIKPGQNTTASLILTNNGNVTASGTLSLNLYASADQTADPSDQLLLSLPSHKISIRAGHSITLKLHFRAPTTRSGGTYYLIASAAAATVPADVNGSPIVGVIDTRNA